MDPYANYNLRGDADEAFRRATRDGFQRAGLNRAQLTQALEWYKDSVRPGMDEAALMTSFHDFATAKGWSTESLVAATSIYSLLRSYVCFRRVRTWW